MDDLVTALRRAAFGDGGAGLGERELAAAENGSAHARWLAAVVLGARGRYGRAATLLERLDHSGDRVLASLACSTLASHRRQLGGHRDARRWDARALRRLGAGAGHSTDADGIDSAGAYADAFLGLAADAIGSGAIAEAATLTGRAEVAVLGGAPVLSNWRSRVRRCWVRAEVELASGRPVAACREAEEAVHVSSGQGAARHTVKSEIVLAAALLATPDGRERAQGLLEASLAAAEAGGWDTLVWPAARVAAQLDVRWNALSDRILHGVLLHADPVGRSLGMGSPWTRIHK